jgi:ribosomal protein S18 acetylase RimI-like enzyme
MITLRELTLSDIPNLTQIHPTFRSGSVLDVVRDGEGLDVSWRLMERELTAPFDKGDGYDFDEFVRADIAERLARPDDVYQRVADFEGRLIGLLEVELQEWNNTANLWNLMIDRDYRGKGLGRRLWHRAVDYARQADVRAILIETQNTNVPACKFYARMGCQICGIHEAYYDEGGEEVAIFWRFSVPRKKV